MLIVKNKRFAKRHAVGGSGIFDTVSSFLKRLITSNTARSIANAATRAAATDIGKSAISAAKTFGKELATSAISTARDVAIVRGKRLITAAAPKQTLDQDVAKARDIITSIINSGAASASVASTPNINNLMMGHGIKTSAIRIEDLVRKMNGSAYGSGLRLA